MTAKSVAKRNVTGWVLFLATLLVLSLAATPNFNTYSRFADLTLIAIRLSLVLALSALVVRERWQNHASEDQQSAGKPDVGSTILQRCRRWFYDE